MEKPESLSQLVGQDLTGFYVESLTEIFKTDDDGRKIASYGFMRDPELAKTLASQQRDAPWWDTRDTLVLTNGVVGFPLGDQQSSVFISDEEARFRIKTVALGKLSEGERQALESR